MKVSVKDTKACEKTLKIEIGSDRIQEAYESFYREVAPKAKIPGFRPGKAPMNIVAMHFQGEAKEQVLKDLLTESYREAVEEESLEPIGYPEVRDIQFDETKLSFEAAVEVKPKIKLSKVKGLSAKKEAVSVKASEIEEGLKRIQESLAQFKAVEDRASALGDFVIADYECIVEGKEAEKRADDWFELKEEEYLKGFSSQLTGAKPGDEKEVKVTFPADMNRKELAGKEAVFKVKIKEIKAKSLPELNDDLAREAGEHTTLAELKAKIEKDLLAQKEKEADGAFEKALLDELVKSNKLDLPPRLVERRIEYMMDQAKQHMAQQGAPEDEFEKQSPKMKESFRPEAERQVHVAFLLEEIAAKENITVEDADLKKHFERIAERFRQPVETVEKYYQGREDAIESLKDQIRSEKTVEFIKQNAKV